MSCSLVVNPDVEDGESDTCTGNDPNGIIDPGELCDDGNASNGDACLTTCQPASCGDSQVRAYLENCDSDALACRACITCSPDEIPFNGRCLSFHDNLRGWSGARDECFQLNKELATFPGLAAGEIEQLLSDLATALGETLPSELWIGLSLQASEWSWVAGDGPAAPDWAPGHPEDGDWRGVIDLMGNTRSAQNGEQHAFLCMRAPPESRLLYDEASGHYYLQEAASLAPSGGTGNFDDASEACNKRSAALLEINTALEWSYLQSNRKSLASALIGLTRTEGGWSWDSGTDYDSNIFTVVEDTGNCAVLSEGQVRAFPCGQAPSYACEWN